MSIVLQDQAYADDVSRHARDSVAFRQSQHVSIGSPPFGEDKQQMAHMLFECVSYDLDSQRIVDFRLKSWADRYLMLRTELYAENKNANHKD